VAALNLVGLDCSAATTTLTDNGFSDVTCVTGDPAGSDDQVGKVYKVEPLGNVAVDQPITLTTYGERAALPAPTDAPAISGEPTAGGTVTLSWGSDFVCPSGTNLTRYTVQLSNGTFVSGGPNFPPTQRSAEVTVADAEGQQMIATYTATCASGDERVTPSSPPLSVTIQPASILPGDEGELPEG
jgi:serine/threonine-protein kinase